MATIFCSKKLQGLFGAVVSKQAVDTLPSPLGDWNGHLFTVERRKCLVFINNKAYYSLFLADILKKDLANFPDLFLSNLIRQMLHDGVIDEQKIPLIKEAYGALTLARTNNDKKAIGTMNDFIYQFKVGCDWKYGGFYQIDLAELNASINDTPVGAGGDGKRNYGWPIRDMKLLVDNFDTGVV